jgi:hypothetical protein
VVVDLSATDYLVSRCACDTMKSMRIMGLVSILISPLALWAVEFTVEGTMHCVDLSGEAKDYQFTFSARGCQWAAKLQWDQNEVAAWGHEGTIFKLMNGPFFQDASSPEGFLASITREEVPPDLPYPVLPTLWTAFVSHCWFDRHEARAIFPPHSRKQTPIRCRVERFPHEPRLPRRIIFIDDGLSQFGDRWPAPFDGGFEVGMYQVKASTVVGEMSIPTEFELLEFQPAPSPEAPQNTRTVGRYTTKVRHVEGGTVIGSFWPPPFPGRDIPTLDFRFGQVPVKYRSDRWLSIEEAMNTPEFRSWRERHDLEYQSPLSPWRVMLTLAAVVAAILPLALWARGKRTVNKTSNHINTS